MRLLKILIFILGVIYVYYKFIKGFIYSNKIKNNADFDKILKEKQVLESEILRGGKATKKDIEQLQDLTQTLQFACYGITSKIDIEGVIATICALFSSNANPTTLYKQLIEICATESLLGTALYDINRGYGYGLWQFDKIAFDDIKDIIKRKHKHTFLLICNKFIENVEYGDLRSEALTACFFARTFIKYRIPSKVGETLQERAEQWKKYYNTYKGKGTVAGYIEKSKQMGVA